jgi:hypothetical protein
MLTDRPAITQVVVMLDETLKQLLQRSPAHLANDGCGQRGQNPLYRALVDVGWIGLFSNSKGIGRILFLWRKLDKSRPLQLKHEGAANHISRLTVGLHPVPCLAQLAGELAAAVARVLSDKGADEDHILL